MFQLELEALKEVREKRGWTNLWVMIPFVRTVEELVALKQLITASGLIQSDTFKLWMMVEIPSNVILLDDFIDVGIDGISIGSNDLTMLILGMDRDNDLVVPAFNEQDKAVLWALEKVIRGAKARGITSSLCGQAASQSLSWSLACSSFSSEEPSIDEQAKLLFCHIDGLVQLARGLGGTALYQDQQMPFWQRRTDSWKKDQDVSVMIHQVILDHQCLARQLREAIAMCQRHHERKCLLALQRVLLETENRARRFARLLNHLHLLSNAQEVSR